MRSAPESLDASDGELVRRVRRGDERAFEQLYQRYQRRITAYIYGMVHDHARAEDLTQDVFVSALRRMRATDRAIAFKPWIYEIAKNACIDQFRRSCRAEEVSYDSEESLDAADHGRLVSRDAMPESRLESKQNLAHLRGAFGGLSETHHRILVLRELEGLSYREIGERMSMSRPSVESTLFRARRRLTDEYEELISGARCQRVQTLIAGGAEIVSGARDRRRLARHVSHCQPCRRQARFAGLDIPAAPDRPIRQRVAALLPLPLFLRRQWLREDSSAQGSSVSSSQFSELAQWSAQWSSSFDPGWLKAVVTAAAVAVAGAGLAGNATTPAGSVAGVGRVVPGIAADDVGKAVDALATAVPRGVEARSPLRISSGPSGVGAHRAGRANPEAAPAGGLVPHPGAGGVGGAGVGAGAVTNLSSGVDEAMSTLGSEAPASTMPSGSAWSALSVPAAPDAGAMSVSSPSSAPSLQPPSSASGPSAPSVQPVAPDPSPTIDAAPSTDGTASGATGVVSGTTGRSVDPRAAAGLTAGG